MTMTSVLIVTPKAAATTPIAGTAKADRLTGTARSETMYGFADDDRMAGEDGHDRLFGGEGDDRMDGGNGHDFLRGDNGNDRVEGEDGNDFLYGGKGDDRLNGGAGDDYLRAHDGLDFMKGGTGADRFVFSPLTFGTTTVEDFTQGTDRLMFFKEGSSYGSSREFLANSTQVGTDTVFARDGFRLVLLNVDRADLTAADFFISYL